MPNIPMINILAVVIQEGTRLASEYIKIKQLSKYNKERLQEPLAPVQYPEMPRLQPSPSRELMLSSSSQTLSEEQPDEEISQPTEGNELKEKATGIKGGCIPCSMGHFATCSGLLNEAMRFAQKEGINEETIDRTGMCLSELNAMERVDLRPEMIVNLPDWEKDLVKKTLNHSRGLRHELEDASTLSVDKLESLAAQTQSFYRNMNREYFNKKLDSDPAVTPELKAKINAKIDEAEAAIDAQEREEQNNA